MALTLHPYHVKEVLETSYKYLSISLSCVVEVMFPAWQCFVLFTTKNGSGCLNLSGEVGAPLVVCMRIAS